MKLACIGDPKHLINYLYEKFPRDFKDAAFNLCLTEINEEINSIFKKENASNFQSKNVNNFESLYKNQQKELESLSPLFLKIINAVAINPKSVKRNILKTADSMLPAVMNAVGTLFFSRNRYFDANASLNTLILRRGKVDKMCIQRLHKLGLCLSHTSLLKKQFGLTVNFRKSVDETAQNLSLDAKLRKRALEKPFTDLESEIPIVTSLESNQRTVFNWRNTTGETLLERYEHCEHKNASVANDFVEADDFNELSGDAKFTDKYVLVSDNVDTIVKPRHYTKEKGNKDLHMFHNICVKYRIPIPEDLLELKAPNFDVLADVNLQYIFPNSSDEERLRQELEILVSRDLASLSMS